MLPGMEGYTEARGPGVGFGLGFSVDSRPELMAFMTSKGTFGWSGAASTVFWVDKVEQLTVVFASQFRFRDDFAMPLVAMLHNLVYACLADKDASPASKL